MRLPLLCVLAVAVFGPLAVFSADNSLPTQGKPAAAWATRAPATQAQIADELAAFQYVREQAQRDWPPRPENGYNWRSAARFTKISEADIDRLSRQKFLIGQDQFKQSFQIYSGGSVNPVFITSDSLLNAYHVLFEDSFRVLEIRREPQLRRQLEGVLNNIRDLMKDPPYPPNDLRAGWIQAQQAIGPALVLLGTPLNFFDSKVRRNISMEVQKIKDAKLVELPVWLAPATQSFLAIDYRRLKPVGFYSDDERLADYFRAVRWLQIVPFRVERNNEFTAIALIGYGAGSPAEPDNFFTAYEEFFGARDGQSVTDANNMPLAWCLRRRNDKHTWSEELSAYQESRSQKRSLIRDDLRFSGPEEKDTPEPFRVLAPYRLPDEVMLQELADKNEEMTGLWVAALAGSSWAENRLSPLSQDERSALDQGRAEVHRLYHPSFGANPTYIEYLDVLATLFAPRDPDAPSFLDSEAWAAKSCQTALASWAQMRHTFTLQSKVALFSYGMSLQLPGFIEPNPAFFRNFEQLVEDTQTKFESAEVFHSSTPLDSLARLESLAARWRILQDTAARLEVLVQKQLRRQPWTAEERAFIKGYGSSMAEAMGSFGDPPPLDNAPRWAEIARDPNTDRSFAAATGRARAMYVLYPWNGVEILCEGAVIPYYESSSKERLTDDEWRAQLDSSPAPIQPAWVHDITAPPRAN